MRTILVATDYSKPARNAAFYALHLANALKANIDLCHAFGLPIESPMLGQIAWSVYEYPDLYEENTKELKSWQRHWKTEKKLGEMKLSHFILQYIMEVRRRCSSCD
jgi:nucleotide-binding universal stress UspA family protein